jgi:hypothetical protein
MLLLRASIAKSAEINIRTVDGSSGAPVPHVVVTVRSLNLTNPVLSDLTTGVNGWTEALNLPKGLYQLSAGKSPSWFRSVRELFIEQDTRTVTLELKPKANIDTIEPPQPNPPFAQPENAEMALRVRLRSSSSKTPLVALRVLLRDSEGNREEWLQTDENGNIDVKLAEPPGFISFPVLIVAVDPTVYTFALVQDCRTPHELGILPRNAICMTVNHPVLDIEIPPLVSSPSDP